MPQFKGAAARVAKWLGEYRKSPRLSQDIIHGFQSGHAEREADLTPADLEAVLSERAALLEALKEAEELLERTLRWSEGWECSEEELLGGIRAAIRQATGEGE